MNISSNRIGIDGLPFLKVVKGWAQLVRLPNVLIVIVIQLLIRYCIIVPYLYAGSPGLITPIADFMVLICVTLLITIGGYVINDYFDVRIDSINRPDNVVVNRLITRHAAIKLHLILNSIAILLGFYLAWQVKSVGFGLIFPLIAALLWIYSAKYKRILFWGNFIVAGLSSFVILVVWLYEFFLLRLHPASFSSVVAEIKIINYVVVAYAIFAFLVTMVREIIKDLEDMQGDESDGCETLPIVAGIKTTRYIAAAIMFLTILLLGCAQIILYQYGLYIAFWYFMITVQTGAGFILVRLFRASDKHDYHVISTLCKGLMVAGVLSMAVIYINISLI